MRGHQTIHTSRTKNTSPNDQQHNKKIDRQENNSPKQPGEEIGDPPRYPPTTKTSRNNRITTSRQVLPRFTRERPTEWNCRGIRGYKCRKPNTPTISIVSHRLSRGRIISTTGYTSELRLNYTDQTIYRRRRPRDPKGTQHLSTIKKENE